MAEGNGLSRSELVDRYEQLATDFLNRAPYAAIPRALLTSLLWYAYEHRPLGETLGAVVSNDLYGAFKNADHVTRHVMWNLVAWLYNEAPGPCWGSSEKYRAWLETGQRLLKAVQAPEVDGEKGGDA